MLFASSEHEPLLDELFADPIIQLLMKTDGVLEDELRPLMEQVAAFMYSKTQTLN